MNRHKREAEEVLKMMSDHVKDDRSWWGWTSFYAISALVSALLAIADEIRHHD